MRDKKYLVDHSNKLAEDAKEKTLFRVQRKPVEAGAHGTLNYTIKKGVLIKTKLPTKKYWKVKNKIFNNYSTSQIPLDGEYVQLCKFLQILMI